MQVIFSKGLYYGCTVLLLFLGLAATGQPALSVSRQQNIYVHYDRDGYAPGETVWFKAYLLEAGRPFTGGNHMMAQLLHPNGDVLQQVFLPVVATTVTGNFHLPAEPYPSAYLVRIFSLPASAFRTGTTYYHWLQVGNASNGAPEKMMAPVDFRFEGGRAISGFKTALAVYTPKSSEAIHGVLRSDRGDTIRLFEMGDGFSKIDFKPYAGRSYFIDAWKENGKKETYRLPAISDSGITMRIEPHEEGRMVYVNRGSKNKKAFKDLTLVGFVDGQNVVHQPLQFADDVDALHTLIRLRSLPQGLLHLFIIDEQKNRLSARVCNLGTRLVQPELISIERSTQNRGLNRFELRFKDSIAKTISISVTDADGPSVSPGIYSKLYLEHELASFPSSVLTAALAGRQNIDDELIAAQSSVEWQAETKPLMVPEKIGTNLQISGKVIHPDSKKILEGGKLELFFMTSDGPMAMESAVSDSGSFVCDSLIFFGEATVFYTYKNKNGKERPAKIIMDKNDWSENLALPVPDEVKKLTEAANVSATGPVPQVDVPKGAKMMDVVRIKTKYQPTPTELVNQKYSSPRFRHNARILMDNITYPTSYSALSLTQFILQRVPKLKLDRDTMTNEWVLVNSHFFSVISGRQYQVQMFVDEFPVRLSQVEGLRIEDVAMIKYHEFDFPAGAVTVYMKRGVDQARPPEKITSSFKTNGYTQLELFEHVNYADSIQGNLYADARRTLYWEPRAYVSEDMPIFSFRFYNNDRTRRFRIRVEGVDRKGNLVFLEKLIE